MRKPTVIIAVLLICCAARAERGELTAGLQGGLLLPAFKPTSATAFTLATWSAGAIASYGVLDELYLTAGFLFFTFEGRGEGHSYTQEGLEYTGALQCTTRVYQPSVGLRWKFVSGYDLAPYLELGVGYAWATFHEPRLLNAEGAEYELQMGDFAEGMFTVTAGVSADYRLYNMLFVGLAFEFTYAVGDKLLSHYFSVPIKVSYYW